VWARHPVPELSWVPATVKADKGASLVLSPYEGGEDFVVPRGEVVAAASSSVSVRVDNLVSLEEFTAGAILHQLRKRYTEDQIYTWIGSILVSINPFKLLPIYTSEVLHSFAAQDITKAPPHVYALAAAAYKELVLEGTPQAFVISGEVRILDVYCSHVLKSGAGKTEVTKLILQYLSEIAGSRSGVEQEMLQTNPILEAFGNAKTLRNNNSSRFGKWMEIRFDNTSKISAAKIVSYLLEKSRVVRQSKGERNYHIFYQVRREASYLISVVVFWC